MKASSRASGVEENGIWLRRLGEVEMDTQRQRDKGSQQSSGVGGGVEGCSVARGIEFPKYSPATEGLRGWGTCPESQHGCGCFMIVWCLLGCKPHKARAVSTLRTLNPHGLQLGLAFCSVAAAVPLQGWGKPWGWGGHHTGTSTAWSKILTYSELTSGLNNCML